MEFEGEGKETAPAAAATKPKLERSDGVLKQGKRGRDPKARNYGPLLWVGRMRERESRRRECVRYVYAGQKADWRKKRMRG